MSPGLLERANATVVSGPQYEDCARQSAGGLTSWRFDREQFDRRPPQSGGRGRGRTCRWAARLRSRQGARRGAGHQAATQGGDLGAGGDELRRVATGPTSAIGLGKAVAPTSGTSTARLGEPRDGLSGVSKLPQGALWHRPLGTDSPSRWRVSAMRVLGQGRGRGERGRPHVWTHRRPTRRRGQCWVTERGPQRARERTRRQLWGSSGGLGSLLGNSGGILGTGLNPLQAGLAALQTANAANAQSQSNQYAKDAANSATGAYNAMAPLRSAGIAGGLGPVLRRRRDCRRRRSCQDWPRFGARTRFLRLLPRERRAL